MSRLQGRIQPLSRTALTVLAFTAYALCNWLLTNKFFPLATPTAPLSRDIGTLVQGAALVVVALAATRRPRWLKRWMFRELPLGLLAAGVAAVLLGSGHSEAVVTLGLCSVELTASVTTVALGCLLMELSPNRMAPCILAGVTAAFCLRFAVDAITSTTAAVIVFCLAMAALILLPSQAAARALRLLQGGETPEELAVTNPFSFLPLNHQLFACLLIFQLGYGFAIGFGEIDDTPVATVAAIVPLAALCLYPAARRRTPRIDTLFTLAFLLAVAGYLFVPFSQGASMPVASDLLEAASLCFSLVYWLCLASIAKRNPTGSLTLFAWGGCILSVGAVSGAALGRVAYGLLVQSPSAATVVCNVVALALVAYALLALKKFSFDATVAGVEAAESVPAKAEDNGENPLRPQADVLPTLAAAHDLTPRETEVFELLAAGRNGVYIQQALGVSYNTVKTHVAHIYAKLGVHTHQELLDFVGRQ